MTIFSGREGQLRSSFYSPLNSMYQATLGSSKTQYPVAAGGAGPVPALPGFYSAPAPGQVTTAAMQKYLHN